MGSIDNGQQNILHHYHFPLDAYIFNRFIRVTVPVGIYDGLELNKVDDSTVQVSPGTFLIRSNNSNDVVKVIVRNYATISGVDSVNNRVVARYEWRSQENWYCDFLAIAPGTELPTDVILGDCRYSGTTLIGIDYHYSTYNKYKNVEFVRGVLDNYSDLSAYLSNNKLGDIFVVKNPSDDLNNHLSLPSFYICKKENGVSIDEVWYTFEISIGTVLFWSGITSNIPAHWHICDGTELSRANYTKLFNVIGTTFGIGNGSTTFNIPNMLDKFVRCENVSGNTGGSDDAVVVEHTHTMQNAGNHTHSISSGTHSHSQTGVQNPRDHHHSYQAWSGSTIHAGSQSNRACNNERHSENTSSAGSHTHSVSSGTHSHTSGVQSSHHTHVLDNSGVDGTGKNMPAYYSQIPIIKIE